jgi:hypothetical protein
MKFWQLVELFRDNPEGLVNLLSAPEWSVYRTWFRELDQLVRQQQRDKLDSPIPAELRRLALAACGHQFYVRDGHLYQFFPEPDHVPSPTLLSATEVYERYGGEAIDEVLEKGSIRLP